MHEHWIDRLSEYLDDELSPADRRALDDHLQNCDECRATIAELRAVVSAAHAIENRNPERDLWLNIVAGITKRTPDTDVVPLRRSVSVRRFSFTMPQLAAAAVILMAVSGAGVWYVTQTAAAPESYSGTIVHTSSAPAANTTLVSSPPATDPTFAATVAELEQTLEQNRDGLDPATVEIIERSLATIDDAMAAARDALQADPGNLYLHRQLESTMQKKIDVLRRATRLSRAGA